MFFKYFGPGKPLDIRAFTRQADKLARSLLSEVFISEAHDPGITPSPLQKKYIAIWDTGATGTVISPKVVQELDLKPIRRELVQGANSRSEVNVYLVNLLMPHNVGLVGVPVAEMYFGEEDALIGMDIISKGDFAVSNFQGRTTFTFRTPSLEKFDFVKEINEEGVRWKAHNSPDGQRQERNRKKETRRKRKK